MSFMQTFLGRLTNMSAGAAKAFAMAALGHGATQHRTLAAASESMSVIRSAGKRPALMPAPPASHMIVNRLVPPGPPEKI
jgi:hypothetical protein